MTASQKTCLLSLLFSGGGIEIIAEQTPSLPPAFSFERRAQSVANALVTFVLQNNHLLPFTIK